jgi:hypothetical protein
MLGRHPCLPLVALLLFVAGCGGVHDAGEPGQTGTTSGVTRQISGNWTGTLHQEGLAPFEIAVDINPDSTGSVAYTGIECGGEWTLDGVRPSTPPQYMFTERIKAGAGGNCKGTGTVSLSPIQGHAPNEPAYSRLNYSFTGGGVTSRGLLHRTDPAHLQEVFKQAGVTGP